MCEQGDDRLYGGDGLDALTGGQGTDRLHGGAGFDILDGDLASGGSDFTADFLFGGAGDDTLQGGSGSSDVLRGGAGVNRLLVNNDDAAGGPGDDLLTSFQGSGRLTGDAGADLFGADAIVRDGASGEVIVTDFTPRDQLRLEVHPPGFDFILAHEELFARLDTDGDRVLTGADGFADQPEGFRSGVSVAANSLTITLGEDTLDLLHVDHVAAADWA